LQFVSDIEEPRETKGKTWLERMRERPEPGTAEDRCCGAGSTAAAVCEPETGAGAGGQMQERLQQRETGAQRLGS
jgi:hypothetical protein